MTRAIDLQDAGAASTLGQIDPRLKLAYLAAVSLASVVIDRPATLAALVVGTALIAAQLRLSRRGWLMIAGVLGATVWATVLTQAMFFPSDGHDLSRSIVPPFDLGPWRFPGIRLSLDGAWYGLVQSSRLAAAALAGFAVCLSTSPERLLAAMLRLRMPTALGFLGATALRSLPTLVEEWASVRRAARMRGYRARWVSPVHWASMAATETRLLAPLLAGVVRRAAALAESVSSRGFDATAPRTFYPPLRMRRGEIVATGALVALTVALSAVKSAYLLLLATGTTAGSPFREFVAAWL